MKKHGLLKILGITVLVLLILTWIIPTSQFTGSEMAKVGLTRLGLFDFFNYPFLAVYYFYQLVLFILIVGGFYGILTKTGVYNTMVDKLAKTIKGKEKIFLVVVSFVLAGLSSVFGFSVIMFMFIPMLISIILLLGYDKVVAFLTTCVSILIGIVGSTYNIYTTGYLNQTLQTTYSDQIIAKIAIFILAYILFIVFTLKYADKVKKSSKNSILEEKTDDKFYVKQTTKPKKAMWPLIVILSFVFVLFMMACIPWADVFGVKVFATFNEYIASAKIGDYTIWSYILGETTELGAWYYGQLAIILLMASLLIGAIYRIKINDFIESFAEGVKKVLGVAAVMVFAMVVVIITAYHPVFPTIAGAMLSWMDGFNVLGALLTSVVAIIGSFLNIEVVYMAQSVVGYVGVLFSDAKPIVGLIFQSMYGITMLAAPTSLMLILGLEYLDIPYTKWLKFSWKWLLELLVIVLIVIVIVTLI